MTSRTRLLYRAGRRQRRGLRLAQEERHAAARAVGVRAAGEAVVGPPAGDGVDAGIAVGRVECREAGRDLRPCPPAVPLAHDERRVEQVAAAVVVDAGYVRAARGAVARRRAPERADRAAGGHAGHVINLAPTAMPRAEDER